MKTNDVIDGGESPKGSEVGTEEEMCLYTEVIAALMHMKSSTDDGFKGAGWSASIVFTQPLKNKNPPFSLPSLEMAG